MQLERLNIIPTKVAQFNKAGIFTAEDLVLFLPRKYKDFSQETGLLMPPNISTFSVTLDKISSSPPHSGKTPYIRASCTEFRSGAAVTIFWFNQPWLARKLVPHIGSRFYVAGLVTYNEQYRNFSCTSPDVFELDTQEARKVYPVYKKIQNMGQEYLSTKIREATGIMELTKETLPYDIVNAHHLLTRKEALYMLHFPNTMEQVARGQERLLFDDLMYFALQNEWSRRASTPGSPYSIITSNIFHQIINNLPFQLTADQQNTINKMMEDLQAGKRLNALVQGDVGCGKTIVAMLMMCLMAENGYQSVLMAPTQVLARQHYGDAMELLEPYGIKVVYLGAELKKKERTKVLNSIADGEAKVIIGTQSVISEDVAYKNLALAIVDEEHRFGVEQRAAIVKKAAEGVHSIKMSATPIPRTLAMSMFGEMLQLYTIRSMPAGRRPVKTGRIATKEKLFRFIIKEASQGHQTYVVCPLIDKSDKEKMADIKSVEEVSEEYRAALAPYGVTVGTLSGNNSKEETKEIIDKFKNNEINVLVSTTVIEVGVNVPTATTMVITNAEMFGLATMHQLRGRVGRSSLQAFCVLDIAPEKENETTRFRVDTMCATTDGFEIAEADMRLRGAGDFLGTQQSGDNKYLMLAIAYPDKYQEAVSIAKELLDHGISCPLVKQVKAERDEVNNPHQI